MEVVIRKISLLLFLLPFLPGCRATEEKSKQTVIQSEDKETISVPDRNDELQTAIKDKDVAAIIKLLEDGLNPDTILENKDGDTLLTWAIRNKISELVTVLIDKKADVNLASVPGSTPLKVALYIAPDDIVFLLIEQGIDWSYIDKDNFTHFERAIYYRRINVLWYMMKIDEAVESVIHKEGLSVEFLFYWSDGIGEIIDELIIVHGFILETNRRLMYWAIYENKYDAVKWLIDHGIDYTTEPDESALAEALHRRHGLNVLEGTGEDLYESGRIIELLKEHTDEQEIQRVKKEFPYFSYILE
jgi:ankyrin repeat protein